MSSDRYGSFVEETRVRRFASGTDAVLDGIHKDDRPAVEKSAATGSKEPVKDTAKALWWRYYAKLTVPGLRTPQNAEDQNRLQALAKALGGANHVSKATLTEATAGGNTILPLEVETDLLARLERDSNAVRKYATKLPMSGNKLALPVENSLMTAYLVAEGGTITDSAPSTAYASQDLVAKKIAGLVTVSNELFNDAPALNEILLGQLAERIGIIEDQGALDSVNFTGITAATGVNSMSCATTGTSGGVTPAYGELQQLAFLAIQNHSRAGGRFFMRPETFMRIASTLDTASNAIFSYAAAPDGGVERFMWGWPVSLVSSLSTGQGTFTTSSNVYFGNPALVYYGERGGLEVGFNAYSGFDRFVTSIRFVRRVGILVPVGSAFSFLKGCKA